MKRHLLFWLTLDFYALYMWALIWYSDTFGPAVGPISVLFSLAVGYALYLHHPLHENQ